MFASSGGPFVSFLWSTGSEKADSVSAAAVSAGLSILTVQFFMGSWRQSHFIIIHAGEKVPTEHKCENERLVIKFEFQD